MELGEKITIPFAKGEKEGIVYKIFPKTVYIKIDFPKQKGKIVKRSIMALQTKTVKKRKAPQRVQKQQRSKEKSTS
jgi:hypothetical protein